MSTKLEKFLAKPVEVTICGDNYMLKPFTVGDLPLLTRLDSKVDEIRNEAMNEIVYKIMKQIDSDTTEELASQVSIEFMTDIMNAVSKINNLDVDDAKQKLLDTQKK